MSCPPVVAVVGPTAAGKSDLAVALATEIAGEVVNADSMQIYKGMDIGTAKIGTDRRRGVPHHLLDLLEVTETASVAQFQQWARAAISDCRHRLATPIVVGGSALYVRAVLDEFEFPGTDPQLRARLEAELAEVGPGVLHERLRAHDSAAAEAILPTNGRRVVRALEVIELTGRPFTATLPRHDYAFDQVVQIGLNVSRDVLDERIATRVDRMWERGFVGEVQALEQAGLRSSRTASRALGYQQVLRMLAGECTDEDARSETVRRTRRFARRQDSWFRRDPRIRWLAHDGADLLSSAVEAVRSVS
ncbi:MAG: tRNA (adenosine(37)-N6)-dimethylallyltransferase MiaA [Nocardioidaceae bacterium]